MENNQQPAAGPGMTWHTDSFWTSAETDKINAALVKFHGLGLAIPKNGTASITGAVKRKYMLLDDILNAVRPALAKVGCYMDQHLAGDSVITRIVHESGQFIASRLLYQVWEGGQVNNLMKMGGGLSYLRRYSAASILALPSDEDTDAVGVDNMGAKVSVHASSPEPRMAPNYAAMNEPTSKSLPWLNLTNKAGTVTPEGAKAWAFVEGGGKVDDILKKYRLNKTDLNKIRELEANVSEALERNMYNQATEQDEPTPH